MFFSLINHVCCCVDDDFLAGEAIYEIGVADNGDLLGLTEDELNQSFDTLQRMAATINAEARSVMSIKYKTKK